MIKATNAIIVFFSMNITGYYLTVLHYDEYHEDDDLFFIDGEKYTLLTIKKNIRNYFKNKSNINVKTNNK